MKLLQFCFLILFLGLTSLRVNGQQKTVSITIDDVPNTVKYEKDRFSPALLKLLDSLDIPFAIFINEGNVYKTPFEDNNLKLLEKWIAHKQSSIGNHTFSHYRYSETGFEDFIADIKRGEIYSRKYASLHNKELKYFRFPYNDMGKDSAQHHRIRDFLRSSNYTLAPFTIESADWMFNYVYEYYLENDEIENAEAIGELYVDKAIELVNYHEAMNMELYGRYIHQIYLCHDNSINADYLPEILERLKKEKYMIVSLGESLSDPVYEQEDSYYKKWGISWIYRWMDTQEERIKWMRQEPDMSEIQAIYTKLSE